MTKKRILLIKIDSKYPNLALEKIKRYYLLRGYLVVEDYKKLTQRVDKVFVSCLFTWNLSKALGWLKCKSPVFLGGSGVSVFSRLPEDIENILPRINWGYTSRGCIRRCPWCSVWVREGGFAVTGSLLDLWDGSSKTITLLDNNILADLHHFHDVAWDALKYKIKLNFFQGLDYRLITRITARILSHLSTAPLRFSFDEPKNYDAVDKCIHLLLTAGIFQSTWFVLVGFNTSFKEDLDRINFLRRRQQKVYLARYNFVRTPKNILLARWTQSFRFFNKMDFADFVSLPENKSARLRAGL